MAKGLTARQREIFDFICETMRAENRPPTVREIADHFNFQSPKAATDHLDALERKGYIRRRNRKARNIEIREELSPQGIPLVGTIAAGSPVLAVENLEGSLSTTGLFNVNERTFALQVEGESMTGAGILPGDYVIVDSGARVRKGAIAVVRIGDEATVKRVFISQGQARLKAENPDYEDIVLDKNSPEFAIYGPVVGVMRKL
ncbi:MAG: transcriptional repressor LexA [Candidatus Brocadiae bacterium]|nr:transcriptional repressor LexA [Candidatus Brocadiia bacterium]